MTKPMTLHVEILDILLQLAKAERANMEIISERVKADTRKYGYDLGRLTGPREQGATHRQTSGLSVWRWVGMRFAFLLRFDGGTA